MDEDDDFIIEELIAATSSVERELGFGNSNLMWCRVKTFKAK